MVGTGAVVDECAVQPGVGTEVPAGRRSVHLNLRRTGKLRAQAVEHRRDGFDGVVGGVEPIGGERGFLGLVRVSGGEQPHGQSGGAGGVVGLDAQEGPERVDGFRTFPASSSASAILPRMCGRIGGFGGEGFLPRGHGVVEGAVARVREVAAQPPPGRAAGA